MICEMCGADVLRTKTIRVEGTELAVCPSCAKFGASPEAPQVRKTSAPPVIADRLEKRRRRMTPRDLYASAGEEDLAVDYSARIREAREARGWTQTDLGAKINERVTVIAKLETGAMVPNEDLSKRLERALNIRLKEKPPAPTVRKADAREGLTLGDLMDLREER